MVITQPTIDDFSDTTVMRVIRKIVNYICNDSGLVAQINDNDITGFASSYEDNVLKISATKGDGSKLPVCNVTIEGGGSSTGNPYPTGVSGTVGVDGNITFTITMSSGSPLITTINMNYFASTADLSDLQEQVTGIKPVVTTNLESSPPTITIAVNGTSSTANLPSGGGNAWEELNYSSFVDAINSSKIGDEFLIASAYGSSKRGIKNCYGICVDETEHIFACAGYFEFNGDTECSPVAYIKSTTFTNSIIVSYYSIDGTKIANYSLTLNISYSSSGLRYKHNS